MKSLCVVILFLLVSVEGYAQEDSGLVWPALPDKPRIKYVEMISSDQPFKHESGGFFSKIVNFLFGEQKDRTWLVQPVGIAVAPDGIVYVADPGAHGVHIFNREKKEYDFLSQTKYGDLLSPVGIAISSEGTIYITDSQRGDVLVLNKDRDPQFTFKTNLSRPTGIALFQNKLYIADPSRQKVLIFDLNGNYIAEFGQRGVGNGEFNFPIAVTAANTLFVVDALNYRVEEFDVAGKFMYKFGTQGNAAGLLASPKSIALDSDGDTYVTDALMDNFQIFNKEGQLLLVVGRQGYNAGEFMSPGGITIDNADNVYVVDMLNKRIQIFKYLK